MGAAFALAFVGCGGSTVSDGDDDEDGNGGTGNGGTGSGGTGTNNGGTLGGGSGGGSGVPREKFLDELTPAEQRRLCEWAIPRQGGAGEHVCEETTVTVITVDECATDDLSGFHCSVSLVEDCITSLNGDPCQLLSTAECAAYISCALG